MLVQACYKHFFFFFLKKLVFLIKKACIQAPFACTKFLNKNACTISSYKTLRAILSSIIKNKTQASCARFLLAHQFQLWYKVVQNLYKHFPCKMLPHRSSPLTILKTLL